MKKAQAIEYLTTYGWALAAMFFIMGGLIYFDIVNPSNYLPETCVLEKNIPCAGHDLRHTADGAAVMFYIRNEMGFDMNNVTFNASVDTGGQLTCEYFDGSIYQVGEVNIAAGSAMEFYCPGLCGSSDFCDNDIINGDKRKFYLRGDFIPEDGRFRRSIEGFVRGSLPVDSSVYVPPIDTTPPVISGGLPTGILPAGTTTTLLEVDTDENAQCRYALGAAFSWSSMIPFSTTGTTHHTSSVAVTDGQSYNMYVRCRDSTGNENPSNYVISFSVGGSCIANTGLISWYSFEDALDLGHDSYGTNHGSKFGNPSQAVGVSGQALSLPGAGARIEIPDNPSLDLTSSFTISLWLNHDSSAYKAWEAALAKGNSAYRIHLCGNAAVCGSNGYFSVGSNGLTDTEMGAGLGPLNGNWQHVVVRYNGTHKQFFIDGIPAGMETATGTMNTNTDAIGIGTNTDVGGRFWDGLIDEISIWSRALTQTEIQNLHAVLSYCP